MIDDGDEAPVVAETRSALRSSDISILARRCTRKALRVLVSIMEDPTMQANARVTAAKEVLNRGWGCSPQRVDVIRKLNDKELSTMAKAILQKREEHKKNRPAKKAPLVPTPEPLQ